MVQEKATLDLRSRSRPAYNLVSAANYDHRPVESMAEADWRVETTAWECRKYVFGELVEVREIKGNEKPAKVHHEVSEPERIIAAALRQQEEKDGEVH